MALLNYSHDRSKEFAKEHQALYELIENFGETKHLKKIISHLNKKYDLPEDDTKKRIKKLIALRYRYRSGKFDKSLRFRNIY